MCCDPGTHAAGSSFTASGYQCLTTQHLRYSLLCYPLYNDDTISGWQKCGTKVIAELSLSHLYHLATSQERRHIFQDFLPATHIIPLSHKTVTSCLTSQGPSACTSHDGRPVLLLISLVSMQDLCAVTMTSKAAPSPKEADACGATHLVASGHNPVCAKGLHVHRLPGHRLRAVQHYLGAYLIGSKPAFQSPALKALWSHDDER